MKHIKKIIAVIVIIALIFGAVQGGIYLVKKNQKKEVMVYPVDEFSMTDYWEDATTSYGTVKTEQLQPIYLSATQTVKEIFVTEGQTVKKGDPLFAYDTTLTEIQVQKQYIEVQQALLALQNVQKELATIQTYKPGVPIPITTASSIQSNEGMQLANGTGTKRTSSDAPIESTEEETDDRYPEFLGGKGTVNKPYRYRWDKNYEYSSDFIEYVIRGDNEAYVSFEVYEESEEISSGDDEEIPMEVIASWWMMKFATEENNTSFQMIAMGIGEVSYEIEKDIPNDEEEENPDDGFIDDGGFDDGGFDWGWDDGGFIDENPGITYTAEEIATMLYDKQVEVRDKELELRSAQLTYEKMQTELNDGTVNSELDGVVQSIGDSITCKQENSVFMNVSAGGGYYVEAYIGELELDNVHVGDIVSINAWESGTYYDGEIVEISEYPSDNGYYYSGNSNSSSYPLKVKLPDDVQVREYESVEVTYQVNQEITSSNTFYLEIPFVRAENGENYVWIADENNQLHKQVIQTGKTVWDSYIEIKGGLSLEDRVAFPYGNNLEEGVTTIDGTSSDFYSSY